MLAFAPDYERLTLMAKVEVFEHALEIRLEMTSLRYPCHSNLLVFLVYRLL